MSHKKEMIETLLGAFDEIKFGSGEPEELARQFMAWTNHVASALQSANMVNEHQAWNDATAYISFVADEPSFAVQAESMKSILLGILGELDQTEPADELFSTEIVEGTKVYIERVAAQVNGCYQRGWYDACAVMMRRLIETLIIECFENHNIATKIKSKDGNYFGLDDLVNVFLNETTWHTPRNMKKYLPKLKELKALGDMSAHDRYFLAQQSDIEKLSQAISFTIQGLVQIAKFQS